MECQLFFLTSADDDTQIIAWGMEITGPEETEAITFRRDPHTRETQFGVHDSAEAALKRYQRMVPANLHFQDL